MTIDQDQSRQSRMQDQAQDLQRRLLDAITESHRLQSIVDSNRQAAASVRLGSQAHRRYFRLVGQIEGAKVSAVLRPDALIAHRALLARAQLLVSMGDAFDTPAGRLRASLDGPPAALMLTLIRACDRSMEVALGPASIPSAGRAPSIQAL
jgi:hypothetical protein